MYRIVDKHQTTVSHEPLVPREVVEGRRNERVFGDVQRFEKRVLPEAGAAIEGGQQKRDAQGQDALNGPRHEAQIECLSVILIPGLDVKGKKAWFW